jgi:hypothetical protein
MKTFDDLITAIIRRNTREAAADAKELKHHFLTRQDIILALQVLDLPSQLADMLAKGNSILLTVAAAFRLDGNFFKQDSQSTLR